MHIDTKLSSDSNYEQGNNHLREFEYINVVVGYAILFAVVVFFTTLSRCCKKYTIEQDRSQSTSNVAEVDHRPAVATAIRYIGSEHRCSSEISVYRPRSSSATQKGRSTDAIPLLKMAISTKPRGLINNGRNTCYFNSVLQALAQTTILEKQLLKIRDIGDMIKEFKHFYASMQCSETSAIDPRGLQRLMSQRTGKFKFGVQHDSHECLLNILHELRKDERQDRGELLTVVDKIFGGHIMTVYTCEVCQTPTHLCEPFLDISLPIPKSRQSSAQRARSGVEKERNRPLPPLYGVKHGIPQQQEVNKHCTAKMGPGVDFDSKLEEHRGRKRKKRADDRSRESSAGSKLEKRENELTRSTTSELTPRTASNEPDPTSVEQDAYTEAVRCMMTTLSIGRERTKLCNPTLDDCLRCYTRKERIVDEYLCRECNSQTETEADIRQTSATKQTLIFNTPAVITFHLKRFEIRSREYVKRDTMVYYEELLDIGPYYTGWWKDEQNQNIWYSLYAVVVHYGSLHCGHYIAYVKVRKFDQEFAQFLQKSYLNRDDITVESLIQRMQNRKSREYRPASVTYKNGTWYCVNDRTVTEVSAREALNQQAFLLFYERL